MKYLFLFFIAILNAKEPVDFFSKIKPKLSNEEQNELTEVESKFVELEKKNEKLSKLLNEQKTEMNTEINKLNEKFQEKDNQLKEINKKNEKIFDKYKESTMEITAKKVYFESESKKLEKENKELKNSPFLPKTAKGWAGLGLILLGTFVVARIYYTLYMT